MNVTARSFDTASKCWLAVLATAFLASVAILAHSFIKASSPPAESSATVQQPASEGTKEVRTPNKPDWSFPAPRPVVKGQRITAGTDPFRSPDSDTAKRQKDAAAKQLVHRQAEALRTMVKQDKLPEGLGNLTLEQIDEMEKKGEAIW